MTNEERESCLLLGNRRNECVGSFVINWILNRDLGSVFAVSKRSLDETSVDVFTDPPVPEYLRPDPGPKPVWIQNSKYCRI